MGGGRQGEEGMFAWLFLVNLKQPIIQASGGTEALVWTGTMLFYMNWLAAVAD